MLVHAPDEEETEGIENIVVQRTWEDALSYVVAISGKTFPLGSKIPIWIKFVPLTKVRIHRLVAPLEETTNYYAKAKRVARHEVPRRWNLLKLLNTDSTPLLPLMDDRPEALSSSALGPFVAAAQEGFPDAALSSMLDPNGPWEIVTDLELSLKTLTRINLSSNHKRSNIAVHHMLRITIRVEKEADNVGLPEGKRKLFDIVIEAPISLNHSYTNDDWIKLPNYNVASGEPPLSSPSASASNARSETVDSRPPAVIRALSPTIARTLNQERQQQQQTIHQHRAAEQVPESSDASTAGSSRQLTRRWLALSETAGRFGSRLELPGERPTRSEDEPSTSEPPPPSYQVAVLSRPVLARTRSDDVVE